MYIEVITPEKVVYEGAVDVATLPGSQGSFQVLNNHAPLISSLVAGEMRIANSKEELFYEIGGGVVEVLRNKIIVLVEKAEEA